MRMSVRPCLCRLRQRLTDTRSKPSILSAACLACCREVIGMAQATVKCHLCGRNFQKPAHEVRPHNFCCAAHARKWNAGRMAEYNRTANPLNKPGGVVSSRRKHREKLSGQGAGKAYRKFYGRHEHRVAAEAMLGRPLRPGEVVHHRDGDKLNNDPMNLEVLPSQAEHTKTQRRDPQGRWCK
uniref:HNH endonuclease n=1 Tax=Siphoviridae sp. ctsAY3 TaxID=2827281 RepID=A0A8S5R2P9_9CAUD|nr:MAG TPA: HNH endonuclease [Siphoviridae sp. ctsAY3]